MKKVNERKSRYLTSELRFEFGPSLTQRTTVNLLHPDVWHQRRHSTFHRLEITDTATRGAFALVSPCCNSGTYGTSARVKSALHLPDDVKAIKGMRMFGVLHLYDEVHG